MLNFAYLNLSMCDNMTAASAAALNAGTDLNSGGYGDNKYRRMHPPQRPLGNMTGYAYEYLADALDSGMTAVKQLRVAAARVFRLRFELGLFDDQRDVPFSAYSAAADVDTAAHRALARQSAAEALVLLRNVDGLLPLRTSALRKLAVRRRQISTVKACF
jgi:beta-glucosidase-like glycosyl hydrolase